MEVPTKIQILENKEVKAIFAGGAISFCLCSHILVPFDEITNCMKCNEVFTWYFRKKHCKYCGGIFCGNCVRL
jgi:hypothetical protein